MKRAIWTSGQIELLRAEYPSAHIKELAARLGRSKRATWQKARELGIRKSPEYIQTYCRNIAENQKKNPGKRFQPGHATWNKGKKGWQSGGRSAEFRFRPGQLNGRAVELLQPIGTERISKDGYRERKVTTAGRGGQRWKLVHNLIWIERHGPIPSGYAVCFRNGDKTDLRLENLELISRKDLMQRNSIHRWPAEIKDALRLIGKLKRTIDAHEKQD
jgi:hypothetical protein